MTTRSYISHHAGGAREPQVGVCVLRVEKQEEYMLITVTVRRHVGRSLTFAEAERSARYADPAEAIRQAERFLESFR